MIKKPTNIQLDRNAFESFTSALKNVLSVTEEANYQSELKKQNQGDLEVIKAFLEYVEIKEIKEIQRQIYKLMAEAKRLGETEKYNSLKTMYLENKEKISS